MSAKKLQHLVMLGLASGLCAADTTPAPAAPKAQNVKPAAPAVKMESKAGQVANEAELLGKLDDKHKAMYNEMDADHKAMAMKMAKQSCAGQNECKGMNSCKGSDHTCAGKGSCAGTSGCAWTDMNKMIDTVQKHMADKRGKVGY